MFIVFATAFLSIWLLITKWKRRDFDKLYEQLNISAWSLPFIGHSYLLLGNKEEQMTKLQELGREAIAKGTIGFWHTNKLYAVTADPEVAEIILNKCLEKDDALKVTHIGIGDGSIFTSVKKWRPRRKLMARIFNVENLNRFEKIFSKQSCILAKKLREVGGRPITMARRISAYSMDAICGTLGIEVNAQQNPDHIFLLGLVEWFDVITARIFQPWLHSDLVFRLTPQYRKVVKYKPLIYDFIDKIIKEKRKMLENNNIYSKKESGRDRSKPFIELMMECGVEDDVVIREESLVLMAGAVDTTAVALGFTLLMLARIPDVQEKVYKELKQVFGDSSRQVQTGDLPHLKYLAAVIRETMRLYPTVPIIARKIDQDLELPSGVTLLAGCGSVIHIWAILRNPAHWGADAEQFRPERFLDGSAAKYPAAYIAFSRGPRNCLGYQYAMMSMKTVLATLLRRYRILPASEELQNKPLRVKFDVMMRHVDNYSVVIESRE